MAARCRDLKLAEAAQYVEYLDRIADGTGCSDRRRRSAGDAFFRDPTVFDHVRRAIAELAADAAGPIRVLSTPCGTGQEAYSVAALMQLCGVPAARFSIDAFDISATALEVAQSGAPIRSARLHHVAADLRDACGQLRGGQIAVHERAADAGSFPERWNLAIAGSLGAEPRYQLILCRNLFIYLDATSRAELARSLAGALLPGGRLFLGTADRVEELSALFAPLTACSFVLRSLGGLARLRRFQNGVALPRRVLPSRTLRRRSVFRGRW